MDQLPATLAEGARASFLRAFRVAAPRPAPAARAVACGRARRILAANGGGAVLNVLSQLSWMSFAGSTGYAASKAAAWSLTNGIRLELAEQGTLVTALMLSATDTDMTAAWDVPKNDPADVVRQALDGLAADRWEVVADSDTAATKANLVLDPEKVYQ